MAFARTYLACYPPDVIKMILSKVPLPDFQKIYREEENYSQQHLCSYADRYWHRYRKNLMEEKLFDDEEDQYLFFAGWEHGEATYNSHMHLPPMSCIRGAVRQQDAE